VVLAFARSSLSSFLDNSPAGLAALAVVTAKRAAKKTMSKRFMALLLSLVLRNNAAPITLFAREILAANRPR
jgi:hypothetical protein